MDNIIRKILYTKVDSKLMYFKEKDKKKENCINLKEFIIREEKKKVY